MGVSPGTSTLRELEIESLAAGGRGVARSDGRVWFVEGGLPGDLVEAAPTRTRDRFVEARTERLLRPSELRRSAPCPLHPRCGGCPWMSLDESEQRSWKGRIVREALERIGRIEGVEIEPVRAGTSALAYRNRTEMTLSPAERTLGFHAADSTRGIVDVERCPVQHDAANRVLGSVRTLVVEALRLADGAPPESARWRVAIRRSSPGGQLLVGLWESGAPFPQAKAIAERLRDRHPEVTGVVRIRVRSDRRGGARVEALSGASTLDETVAGTRFRLPAASFVQVNAEMADALAELVLECAGPLRGTRIFDLFGGIGAYGLAAAKAGATSVTVCDADRDAIACGRRAAWQAHLPGVHFVHDDVRRWLASNAKSRERPDAVLINPPRVGFGAVVAAAVASTGTPRIVIVSCDPATLARDVRALVERGYRVARVVPVDMFPQTAHVEVVVKMVKGSAPPR